jgi:dihydrofolate reductase
MGLLTFALNVTLDGCCDHREGIVSDETHRFWTRQMDGAGAMLFGRVTYEMMEAAWPQVARDPKAAPALRAWARKLEAKPKYVVSTTRHDYAWANTHHLEGDLARAVKALKKATPRGILVGSPALSAELLRLDLVDEFRFVVHPVVAGHGPYLFAGLQTSRRLELAASRRLGSGIVLLRYRRRPGRRQAPRPARGALAGAGLTGDAWSLTPPSPPPAARS